VASAIVIVPFTVGLIRIRSLSLKEKTLLLLSFFALITESIALYLRSLHTNNLIYYHIYTTTEFCLLSIYFFLLISARIPRSMILAILLPFLILAYFDTPSVKLNTIDNLTTTFEGIAVIIYCIGYFYSLMLNPVFDRLLNAPSFWFVTSFLIYFSGTLFLFIFDTYMKQIPPATAHLLWGINSGLVILFNILFAVGFWKTKMK
jgi:hypothetical protein